MRHGEARLEAELRWHEELLAALPRLAEGAGAVEGVEPTEGAEDAEHAQHAGGTEDAATPGQEVSRRTSLWRSDAARADVERSKGFYLKIPGAALEYQRAQGFALIRIGRTRLGLFSRSMLPADAPRFHPEVSTSAVGVDALHDEVRRAGIRTDGPPEDRSWGDRSFYASDPDGNWVEFDSQLAAGR